MERYNVHWTVFLNVVLRFYTINSNVPAITVVPEPPIHGQQFTLTCTTEMTEVTWYKFGQILNFNYSSEGENNCSIGTSEVWKGLKATKCDHIYNLTIVQVDYYRDNSSVFQCQAGTESCQYQLHVNVYPTFITDVPIDGNSFDITCFSTVAVSWYRKGIDQDCYFYIASSSPTNGCSVDKQHNYYEFNSCDSVNQTLTIKSVDFDRDNGSIWNCSFQEHYDSYTLKITTTPPTLYGSTKTDRTDNIGANVTFSVEYLDDRSLNVSWYHENRQLINSSRVTITESTEILVNASGIKTILTITSINITDQGNYTCQVCNQYGCSRETFQLLLAENVTPTVYEDQGTKRGLDDTVIIGVAVGATVLVIGLVVVIFFVTIRRRNSGQPFSTSDKERDTHNTGTGMREVPFNVG
ncbi:hypothetical protein LOTGIDRAFT_153474 [Lottia gigantea]|uniref:Ig-like domain-containing protein n=1 Tax=Lottia gigantea TaxID=225164 RepID=V4AKC0_LOTGI|nr:hypothetical protein LOTGIDRAFT_153474 [Lottia gigantea]ESO93996.1 hypothetical protein LOTGIDRAFT_153474 [Lottia gigantea]